MALCLPLGFEEAFKEAKFWFRLKEALKDGRGIQGGNFWLGQTRHPVKEIFDSDKRISKIFKKKNFSRFECFIFFYSSLGHGFKIGP